MTNNCSILKIYLILWRKGVISPKYSSSFNWVLSIIWYNEWPCLFLSFHLSKRPLFKLFYAYRGNKDILFCSLHFSRNFLSLMLGRNVCWQKGRGGREKEVKKEGWRERRKEGGKEGTNRGREKRREGEREERGRDGVREEGRGREGWKKANPKLYWLLLQEAITDICQNSH